ncbi:aspartate 1-decarboxylase [Ferroacidibacillus organovorans]|uniref:Aspartate 1-decarboxylase n=3 Tax=Ferroacidibacillus organovorans TaxID=1765683 RepID=A0A1V4EWJ5_9BACL|nr:aspartate 1-decarboxylase [Ferroacidibacillus organovorans]OPG17307.1 aspartate 1-decarboxylase [Ferroacidibacillus organovorans]
MLRTICKGKIHRAVVTEAQLDYVGSITLDRLLMKEADILPYEMVQITSVANATLWKTYAIPAPEGSGTVCLNGPPARHFQPGDLIIVLSIAQITGAEYDTIHPRIVHVDHENQIVKVERHSLHALRKDGQT